MSLPGILLGFFVSTLFGAAFHLVRGGGLGRLILYLFLSWFGFIAGHLLGNVIGLKFWVVGTLNLGPAILGNLLLLGLGYWLSLVRN